MPEETEKEKEPSTSKDAGEEAPGPSASWDYRNNRAPPRRGIPDVMRGDTRRQHVLLSSQPVGVYFVIYTGGTKITENQAKLFSALVFNNVCRNYSKMIYAFEAYYVLFLKMIN